MIELREMTETEFREFLERSIPEFAAERVRAGNWSPDEAQQKSEETYQKLLPVGLATPGHHLYMIEQDGSVAGDLWLAIEQPLGKAAGFIYDLYISEAFRRQGIATQAMKLVEDRAIQMGLKTLSLHVFGDNFAARHLYEQLGYEITNLVMLKKLDG